MTAVSLSVAAGPSPAMERLLHAKSAISEKSNHQKSLHRDAHFVSELKSLTDAGRLSALLPSIVCICDWGTSTSVVGVGWWNPASQQLLFARPFNRELRPARFALGTNARGISLRQNATELERLGETRPLGYERNLPTWLLLAAGNSMQSP